MAKFAIECPNCGSVNTASTFILAKKVIKCGTCSSEIDTRVSRMTSKKCPDCGTVFVCDQAKKKDRKCPGCGKVLTNYQQATTVGYKLITINCPQCSVPIEIDKYLEKDKCPICDCIIDVKREIARSKIVDDAGVSIIKYEGDNTTFVWKHPIEDFNLGSQLIVHESQEAILLLNGEAVGPFGAGEYTLETENLPILKKLYKLPTGGQQPFHAEVYFFNMTVQLGIKWGTDSRIRFIEPASGIPLDIGAHGELNLSIANSRKLLIKLVGTEGGFTAKDLFGNDKSVSAMKSYFRAPLMTGIKSYLATIIKEQKINILEIDERLSELSTALQARINPNFEEYGLAIAQFFVTEVSLPDDDKNFQEMRRLISAAYLGVKSEEVGAKIAAAARERKLIEEEAEAERRLVKARAEAEERRLAGLADAEVMAAKGYTQRDVIAGDVQKAYAEGLGKMGSGSGGGGGNMGGGMVADIVGLGVGMAAARDISSQIGGVSIPSTPQMAQSVDSGWTCSCGHTGNTGKCCSECGKQKAEPWNCSCGHAGNTGKCCSECGKQKPEPWNCSCGQTGNTGKCCSECGKQKPEPWDCSCGHKGNTGKCCSECGKSIQSSSGAWDCACGKTGNTGRFCDECGTKRPE